MKCRFCEVVIDQNEADAAAEIVGEGHETLCVECAESLAATSDDQN